MIDKDKKTIKKIKNDFDINGYTLISQQFLGTKNIIQPLQEIIDNLFEIEDWKGGWEGKEEYMKENKYLNFGAKRLSNLINKSDLFLKLINNEKILEFTKFVFEDNFHIGGVDVREPMKGFGQQALHQDWFPRQHPNEKIKNMIGFFFLDNADRDNGTLRVIPASHKLKGWVSEHLENTDTNLPNEIYIKARSGDLVMMDGNLWHSGNKNINGQRRRVVYIDFRSYELPQLLNQKKYLSKKRINELPENLKKLLKVRDEDPLSKHKTYTTGDYCRENNLFWPKG